MTRPAFRGGGGLSAAARRRGRPTLVLATAPAWPTAVGLRLRQARVGSLLAFLRDGALVARGLLRKIWRSPALRRTPCLRRLELAWHASGAATQLADAALAAETTTEIAT